MHMHAIHRACMHMYALVIHTDDVMVLNTDIIIAKSLIHPNIIVVFILIRILLLLIYYYRRHLVKKLYYRGFLV